MIAESLIHATIESVAAFASNLLMPIMVVTFCVAVLLRGLIFFTLSREFWFGKEFEKRVNKFFEEKEVVSDLSFYVTTKRLLEKTYYELFEVRGIMLRRKPDAVASLTDRVFLIQHGCARLIKSTLNHIRFLKYDGAPPKLLETSKHVFENNPCFNRIFGVIPTALVNEILNVLAGLFIIGGIFGTFLGIMKALPGLGGMNLSDIDSTRATMDAFLLKVSFSMSTSVVGIFLSVALTLINTAFSVERMFVNTVNRFETCLTLLWNRCVNNQLPSDLRAFDEHRDPLDALAEQALKKELEVKKTFIRAA